MKPQHLLMAASLALVAWLALFGDKNPSGGKAEAVVRATSANTRRTEPPQKKPEPEVQIQLLQPRTELIGGAGIEKNSAGLFLSQSWTPPPPAPAKLLPPPPPPPPGAPALPFTYIGKKFEDGKWEIYLARGEQSIIVGEHTAIDNLYRSGAIKTPFISIIYLPLNIVQTLNIGESE
jgi:hypothetical protein